MALLVEARRSRKGLANLAVSSLTDAASAWEILYDPQHRTSEPPMTTSYRDPFYSSYVSQHQGELDASLRYPTFERDVLARLPKDSAARILDAGCGQGDLVKLIADRGWSHVGGVDASEEQVATARRRGVVNVIHGDIFEYSDAHAGAYDVVLAMDVLEHFDRREALGAFCAMRHMLAPGGSLILQVPNGASPFSGRIYWSDITHGMQYTALSLAQICAAAGFESVACFPTRPAVHGVISMLRAIVWRVCESLVWLATAAETGRTRGHVLTHNVVAVARQPGGTVGGDALR